MRFKISIHQDNSHKDICSGVNWRTPNELFRYPGAIFSVELTEMDCFEFLNRLDLVICTSNLGDTRSLGIPVAHSIYFEMGPERRASMGIDDSLVRFSIGIEDTDDLLADFEQALR